MRGFDLFSGIGGFHEGAKSFFKDRYETVAFCDFDEKARQAYKACIAEDKVIEFDDVNDLTGIIDSKTLSKSREKLINNQLPDFDILFAGFPCQPFSSMGSRLAFGDDRGVLFFNIEMILKAKKPKYFILENVRGLKTIQGGEVMDYIMNSLKKIGYQSTFWLLNSADYGVPQIRNRTFVFGNKIGYRINDCPEPTPFLPACKVLPEVML